MYFEDTFVFRQLFTLRESDGDTTNKYNIPLIRNSGFG
jgi:hypothetical protein